MSEDKEIVSDEHLQKVFQTQDWKTLWIVLQAHAVFRLKCRYGIIADRITLQAKSREFVQEALNRVFVEKTRSWNITANPELKDFLFGVIDSIINNSFKVKPKEVPIAKSTKYSEEADIPNVDEDDPLTHSHEKSITAIELRKQISDELKKLKADDDELLVFECLFDGIIKPEDIRNELGISEIEFHNIWRKVNRKREKIKTKLESYGY